MFSPPEGSWAEAILSRRGPWPGIRTLLQAEAICGLFLRIYLRDLGLKDTACCRGLERFHRGQVGWSEGPPSFPEAPLPLGRGLERPAKRMNSRGAPAPSPALWGQSLPIPPHGQSEET